ncbi:tail protein X [Maritalea porphyrae]|uniref:tail protein X n=1 Tax=Maritalea porphyrae TaxID=880732 RepID=UPI0022B0787E|nr:tail protein X [Maritalea porphyrae]MCZ4272470.1 tail protein X [Maritalea porphyrae]
MAEDYERVIVKSEQNTLSRLVWRKLKRFDPDYFDRVADINSSLAQHGPYLPVGAVVLFPKLEAQIEPVHKVETLWD